MHITRTMLDQATDRGLLREGQATALWSFLSARVAEQDQHSPRFKAAHILYYLGGLTAIGAMSLFMTLGWERLGGGGLWAIASAYALAAALAAEHLLHKKRLALPAGILAVLAVALVPLAVYGAQRWLGWWPAEGTSRGAYRDYHAVIDWRWLLMELATLAAGAIALWRWRLPFLVLPVAVTLWYLSMDIVPVLLGGEPAAFFSDEGKRVSTAFGLGMVALAFWVDLRSAPGAATAAAPAAPAALVAAPFAASSAGAPLRDFAFWLYIFGVFAFWGGLTSMESHSELGRLLYACVNLLLITVGTALSRRVFAVFGAIDLALYLGHLSHTVFRDSLLFPLALAAIGLAVMAAGVWWQRHEARIGNRLRLLLPDALRVRIEQRGSD